MKFVFLFLLVMFSIGCASKSLSPASRNVAANESEDESYKGEYQLFCVPRKLDRWMGPAEVGYPMQTVSTIGGSALVSYDSYSFVFFEDDKKKRYITINGQVPTKAFVRVDNGTIQYIRVYAWNKDKKTLNVHQEDNPKEKPNLHFTRTRATLIKGDGGVNYDFFCTLTPDALQDNEQRYQERVKAE